MKLIAQRLLLLSLFAFLFQSCQEDAEPVMTQVQFSGNVSDLEKVGGRITGEDDPTHLLISLNSGGEQVLVLEKVNLYRLDDSFITEPLDLVSKGYQITDFLLINESGEILYAIPKFGSAMQKAVSRPLPFNFFTKKEIVSTVEVEVLNTKHLSLADLGYSSFESTVVNPLRISVTTADNPTELTEASGRILRDGEVIEEFDLDAKINLISFPGDEDANYQLIVEKEGYPSYQLDFIYAELAESLESLLLKVVLEKSLSITTNLPDWGPSFEFDLEGTGSIMIDWGDGTVESANLTLDGLTFTHVYAVAGMHPIKVTGDVDQITYFYSFYGGGVMSDVDFSCLSALEEVRIGFTDGPEHLDFSNNSNLDVLLISTVGGLKEITLPPVHSISTGIFSYLGEIETAAIDKIIDNMYKNATENGLTGSSLALRRNFDEFDNTMVGPPSSDAFNQLTELRDTYGWSISPDF